MDNLTFKKWNTITGWALFAVAFVVYSLTVERTLSFWDCGEYISTAAKLEVGHPPGAPLFQMAGAVAAIFGSETTTALMVNMVSVLSSAFTILFMFWSLTIVLKNVITSYTTFDKNNAVAALGASAIASLAFLFSDSFWFNATEAEVYAMASLFIALLLWAGLKWGEEMHGPRGNRWLLLISLLVGLSFGVHFMALLTIPSIGLIYFFKNYKTVTVKNFIIANIVIVLVLFFVFAFLAPYTLALFGKTEIFMVNELRMPFNSGTIFMFLLLGGGFYYGLTYTKKKGFAMANTVVLCLLFIIIGFATWFMLPLRANANTPINENNPSNAAEVLAYYNREQYPEQKTFFGPLYTEKYSGLDPNTPYTDGKPNYEPNPETKKYEIVNKNYKGSKQNLDDKHKAFLPRMGSSDHAANYMRFTGAPKYRINPDYDFATELMQQGIDIEAISPEEAGMAIAAMQEQFNGLLGQVRSGYSRHEISAEDLDHFLTENADKLIVEKPDFSQNMAFMFEYQFGYMYWRYLMWNFSGRQSDEQGNYDNVEGNWITGIKFLDESRLGPQDKLTDDMQNNKGRNAYYMIPFVLAVVGMIFHARKDLKSFYVLLALFLFTGIALKIFLNERPFEVRERDYALVGSYYVFAMWIAFGVYAIYDGIKQYLSPKVALPVVLGATLLGAPVLMASQNWDDHDRSGRYTAIAMAKAYLASCEPNAILFTIGDNDTFPLWYAQEIEGFRTDVRIVCSTLLPTDWYIDQMQRKAYESAPLPISFKHRQYVDGTRDFMIHDYTNPHGRDTISIGTLLDSIKSNKYQIQYARDKYTNAFPSKSVRIPVDRNQVIKNKVIPQRLYDSIVPYIDIKLPNAIYKHNMIMLDIIRNNNWERPIHFSGGSFDAEDYIWMKDYLELVGVTYKLVPVKTKGGSDPLGMGYVDGDTMYDIMTKLDWGNGGSTDIYHDPQTRRNSLSFRKNLARAMQALIDEGKPEKARKVIDIAMKNFPLDYYGYYFIMEPFAGGYYQVGDKAAARQLLEKLMAKYRQNLEYYRSLPVGDQNVVQQDIGRDIEQYRSLLLVMQENNDTEFYNKHKPLFNQANGWFKRLGLEDEK
ncbi:hypothetical protein AM493_17585 [Flavobacterium akiainvivens]|uniref:Glycosyltransferase n=1 Tax=Flavobacterium akiainvivens TaxID=1202724 RepID=A0A0M9VJD9_9FLAO|nr:DUF2723 domain-containing protein [Flavobacterium akiainvivens]KOS07652.1 hypothetical protein AM493_17585 [Flavobacterium akiainvivens]SFQ23575.1 Protein of unknown function [Flavobacterium akiainvivens]